MQSTSQLKSTTVFSSTLIMLIGRSTKAMTLTRLSNASILDCTSSSSNTNPAEYATVADSLSATVPGVPDSPIKPVRVVASFDAEDVTINCAPPENVRSVELAMSAGSGSTVKDVAP